MKQKFKLSILFLVTTIFLVNCGPKVYQATDASFEESLRKRGRNVLAILPFQLSAEGDQTDRGIDPNRELGYKVQKRVYIALLDQFGKRRYNVEFQDIDQTNASLRTNHIYYEELFSRDKSELCRLLGVDGVISGNINSALPLTDGTGLAVHTDINRRLIPNKTNVSLMIHDQQNGKLVWRYDYETPTVMGNNVNSMMEVVMQNVSTKFPYKKK